MSAKTTLTATTHSHPCILSCGYKSIYIPKSGLEFPAWLVCFDTEPDNEQEEQSGGATSTPATCTASKTVASDDDSIEAQRRRPCKKARQKRRLCYFWRSKRDFWRLGRATAASLSSSSSSSSPSKTIVLPKAAWKKLSNEAPWKRPDYNDYYATDIHNDEDGEEEAHVQAHPNGWKRHMYKSLRQVDQYLQQVAQPICSSNCDIHHDCNNMNTSDQQQQQCKTCTVKAAWKEFCRPCHTEDLKDNAIANSNSQVSTQSLPPAVPAVASTAASITTISTAMTGNALGQYFCHPANARQLVRVCLERIQQVLLRKNHHVGHQTTQFLFVEPSCGHGQVLEVLLDELGRRQQQQQQQEPLQTKSSASATHQLQLDLKQCSFVGMDIDPTAIAHCREHFSKRYQRYCSDDDNKNNKNTQPDITWLTLDFLQSQRSCVMKNSLHVDGTHSSGTTENEIMVIVLGGPPYSVGAGRGSGQRSSSGGDDDDNGSDGMQRDLPMRFVQHAKQEWGASIVTFLMPERCGRHNKSLLSTDLKGDTTMQPNDSNNKGYALANIPLDSPSVFYFQGLASAAVKQPSIIQCFWRAASDETAHVLNS